ncbi:SH3 domain-containing protein [Breznakibacter xylanolyticus]|uniref:SH3 domain-containing protein n=1 Tax=Breznakibacter xylanolyticus TaxID=990 RepID=A0A2W7MW53_9BACT|nr:C40 family peptidase [Breznakibacter xylanolyticus]PZX11871.1 SH3 domain-containing protein [Breznakibacter xylanolyticus]
MTGSICTAGFIPVRAHASETAEMVTQIVFGETYEILQMEEKWARIRMDYDGYEGWIDAKMIVNLPERELDSWRNKEAWMVPSPLVKVISDHDKSSHTLTGGSRIVFNGSNINSFTINNCDYYLTGSATPAKKMPNIQEIAMNYLNTPYLWGGRTFYGIDCSGLVQMVYKIIGVQLPRDASQQIEHGTTVEFVEETHTGDIAFFCDDNDIITHVGICIGKGDIIHASGVVRIDKLDHQGIYNTQLKKYTHKLKLIKRVI